MKIDISAQKMELTPALKKYIDRKFARLEKFNKDFQLQVHLSSIKHKAVVHLILSGGKETHQATEDRYDNIYKAINKAYNKIKKPIRRSRKGVISKLVRKFKKTNESDFLETDFVVVKFF